MAEYTGIRAPKFDGKNYKIFKELLTHYLDATKVTDEKQKLAVLFTRMGTDGYSVYRTIKKDETDTALAAALTRLEKHYVPQKNVTYERHKFRQRKQGSEESIDDFITALRTLARECKFGQLEDEAIRDQLVEGTNEMRVQERLLAEKDLKLDKAILIARSVELAKEQVKGLKKNELTSATPLNESGVFQVGKSTRPNRNFSQGKFPFRNEHFKGKREFKKETMFNSKCTRCGLDSHTSEKCGARNARCRKCGHYALVCKTTRVGLLVEPDNLQETIKPETKNLADNEQLCDVVGSNPYGIFMNQEESELQYDSYVMKQVILNGKSIKFVVDTGSPFTVIPFSFYQKYFNDIPLRQSKRKLYSYDGYELKIKGFIEINTEIDTDKRNVPVLVIDTGGPPLLGLDLVKNVFKLLCVMESDIQEVIDRNKDIFEGIGFARDYPINIKLQENAQPVFRRSTPYHMR